MNATALASLDRPSQLNAVLRAALFWLCLASAMSTSTLASRCMPMALMAELFSRRR